MTALVLYSESLNALALLEWRKGAWWMQCEPNEWADMRTPPMYAYDWTLVGEI